MKEHSFLMNEFKVLNESTVLLLVQEEDFKVMEYSLFVAVFKWAIKECEQRGIIEVNPTSLRQVRE